MGGFATHAIFGKEVLDEISDEMLVSVIQKHPGVFGIGCQGPDLFLYNIAMLLSKEEKNLGYRMHKENTSRYFAWLMQTIWDREDLAGMEIGISYLYGALTHYTLDSMLHPYIYARIGLDASMPHPEQAVSGLHHRMESAIDAKMIAVKEKGMPSSYDAGENLRTDRREREILSQILSKAVSKSYHIRLKEENVAAAIHMMKVIAKGFFAASDRQKELLRSIERPFHEDYGISNFMVTDAYVEKGEVMNTENHIWHNPWDREIALADSVWEIYDKAVVQYHVYCGCLSEVLLYFKRRWLKESCSSTLYRKTRRSDWQREGKRVYREKSSDIMKQMQNMENVIGFFPSDREEEEKDKMCRRIYDAAKGLGNLSYESGLPPV